MKWLLAALVIWLAWKLLAKKPAAPRVASRAVDDEVEACRVLGIAPDADAATVRAAHRRLVGEVHPDKGGSAERTRRVNAARDLLLDRRG